MCNKQSYRWPSVKATPAWSKFLDHLARYEFRVAFIIDSCQACRRFGRKTGYRHLRQRVALLISQIWGKLYSRNNLSRRQATCSGVASNSLESGISAQTTTDLVQQVARVEASEDITPERRFDTVNRSSDVLFQASLSEKGKKGFHAPGCQVLGRPFLLIWLRVDRVPIGNI